VILLPQSPECWDYRHISFCLALHTQTVYFVLLGFVSFTRCVWMIAKILSYSYIPNIQRTRSGTGLVLNGLVLPNNISVNTQIQQCSHNIEMERKTSYPLA
jgi:hypothetical protein